MDSRRGGCGCDLLPCLTSHCMLVGGRGRMIMEQRGAGQGFGEHRRRRIDVVAAALLVPMLCSGCADDPPPPPPSLVFGGLPVRGSLEDAHRAGFTACFNPDATRVRCRRSGVMLLGQGPYQAAIDLIGGAGAGGFGEVTLWHDRDQYAVYKIRDALKNKGWRYCYTGSGTRGDQAVFSRPDVAIRIWMDLSYWGKRRLRLVPLEGTAKPDCTPDRDLVS